MDDDKLDRRAEDGMYAERQPFYAALYPRLREAARLQGYALALHGSLQKDLDLVAAPWTQDATGEAALVQALVDAAGGLVHPDRRMRGRKPHGRRAWTIMLGAGAGYIDLAVLPTEAERAVREPEGAVRNLLDAVLSLDDDVLADVYDLHRGDPTPLDAAVFAVRDQCSQATSAPQLPARDQGRREALDAVARLLRWSRTEWGQSSKMRKQRRIGGRFALLEIFYAVSVLRREWGLDDRPGEVEVPLCPCGNPPTCVGEYEGDGVLEHGCDQCCGHGCEDGWCVPVYIDEDAGHG